jgi:hypothetical protein
MKNWSDFLDTPQKTILFNALINEINHINFDGLPCTSNSPPVAAGATCLTTLAPGTEYTPTQLAEICNNLRLAINYLVFVLEHPNQKEALSIIENIVKDKTDPDLIGIVEGLFNCLDKVLLPLTFTCENCFKKFLTANELSDFLHYLSIQEPHATNNLEEYCKFLANLQDNGLTTSEIKSLMSTDFKNIGIAEKLYDVIECIQTIQFLR